MATRQTQQTPDGPHGYASVEDYHADMLEGLAAAPSDRDALPQGLTAALQAFRMRDGARDDRRDTPGRGTWRAGFLPVNANPEGTWHDDCTCGLTGAAHAALLTAADEPSTDDACEHVGATTDVNGRSYTHGDPASMGSDVMCGDPDATFLMARGDDMVELAKHGISIVGGSPNRWRSSVGRTVVTVHCPCGVTYREQSAHGCAFSASHGLNRDPGMPDPTRPTKDVRTLVPPPPVAVRVRKHRAKVAKVNGPPAPVPTMTVINALSTARDIAVAGVPLPVLGNDGG